MQTFYFISHSTKDKPFVECFIDFLQTGMNIGYNNVFCSSDGDIPITEDFIKSIKEHLEKANVVFFILTENFFESKFCLSEIGAAWALNKILVPIVIPPITFDILDQLPIRNTQSVDIHSSQDFLNLYDNFIEKSLIHGNSTARYITKVNELINQTKTLTSNNVSLTSNNVSQTSNISYIDYESLKNGVLFPGFFGIGTPKKFIIEAYGQPTSKGTFEGAYYYLYDNAVYFFIDLDDDDDESKVTEMIISGEGIKREDIIKKIGNPTDEGFSDKNSEWYMSYVIGDYRLWIGFITEKSKVSSSDPTSEDYYSQYLIATRNSDCVSYMSLRKNN